MDITPRDAAETNTVNLGKRITVALGIVIAAATSLLAAVGGLEWILDNLALLGTGLGALVTGGLTAFIAVRRMRVDRAARKAAVVCLLFSALILCGCAMTYNATPIMSESGGETVVSDAINIKFGIGTKEATSIGAYKLSADGGLSIDNLDSKSDSSAVLLQAITLGAQLGGAYLKTQGVPVQDIVTPAADEPDPAPAADDAQVAYSTEGYGGSPGPAGEGVYGRPSCARCRAYRAAHPDVAIINIDDAGNRADMWAALRLRNHTGSSAELPVAVTATAFTLAAR